MSYDQTAAITLSSQVKKSSEKNYRVCWVALHRPDGAELSTLDATGYQRRPYTEVGARWPETVDRWGVVSFASVWTAKVGGRCVSEPPLQALREEWLKRGSMND